MSTFLTKLAKSWRKKKKKIITNDLIEIDLNHGPEWTKFSGWLISANWILPSSKFMEFHSRGTEIEIEKL